MDGKAAIWAGASGVAGLVLGMLIGGGGPSEEDINRAVTQAMAPAQEANADAAEANGAGLAALDARLAAIEAALAEGGPDAGPDPAALRDGLSEDLGAALAEMRRAIGADLAAAAQSQQEALDAALSHLGEGLEESARVAAAAVATAAGGATEGGGVAGGSAVGETTVTEPLGVGRTALFADGRVRVFVSRIDAEGGSAALSFKGETRQLGAGGSVKLALGEGKCTVSVMALTPEGVTLGSDCDASARAAEAAQAAPNLAPENGLRPGNSMSLADGALRVFLAALNEGEGSARLAINGVQTYVVATGESVEVPHGEGRCRVTVTGIGEGMVGLEGACQ